MCNRLFIKIGILFIWCVTSTSYARPKLSNTPWYEVFTPRIAQIDVKHIALDLQFDWKKKQAYGTATINLSPLKTVDFIVLDAVQLAIHSITIGQGKNLKFEYNGIGENDGLKITLDRMYRPSELITLKIKYNTNFINNSDPNALWGSFGKGLRFFEPTSTEPNKRRQIWSVGEPELNRYWFPCHDVLEDRHTTEFIATVDSGLTVVANGALIQQIKNKNGTITFHWKTKYAHSNHATSFVVGEYVDILQHHKGVALHNFGYPDEAEGVRASIARLPDMVRYFSEITGQPYPYPSYAQVFVQDFSGVTSNNSGWMANTMFSTITENMVDDYRTHADFFYLWDLTEAESLAHQWFGNLLYIKDWSQLWLNNAFSHYFNCMYNEYKNGKSEFLMYQLAFDQSAYLADWNSGYRRPVIPITYDSPLTITNDNYSALRGGLVLHMLRKHLGETKWLRTIKSYVHMNAHKPVDTDVFLKAVRTSTGEDVRWFFDQWLYGMGHPIFEVHKLYDPLKKKLTLEVKQTQVLDTQTTHPQARYFKGKIDVEIDDHMEQVWLEPKANQTFVFAQNQAPRLVHFDFESAWIKELTFEKPQEELIYQALHDKDILGQNWALAELVKQAKKEETSMEQKENIYAVLRTIIESKSYWRLRLTALTQLSTLLGPKVNTQAAELDPVTIEMLLRVVKTDTSWVRARAIHFLGLTRNAEFADVFLQYLKDESDRVINTAAIALGKSKSPKAFEALIHLADKPSWKNQSLISSLNGLRELGDPRGIDFALNALANLNGSHWTLATSVWDYRLAAAETLVALGRPDQAYPMILERFKTALVENDINDIFSNVLLITTLADPRGKEVFDQLNEFYQKDSSTLITIQNVQNQFMEIIQSKK